MITLYLYQSRHATGRSETWVIQGDQDLLDKYISSTEYAKLFGGYIKSRAQTPSGQAIGVWGLKTIKRFRRVLRERGVVFQQLLEEPPGARIKAIGTSTVRPKGLGAPPLVVRHLKK